jgi:tripartite ATP-independent transporter DctM subunit
MEALIGALIIVLALLGAPLFAIFGGAGMALFAVSGGNPDWGANEVFTERFSENNLMVTIPLFIFAGYIMAESGTPRRLVALSRAWLGWLPGGLAIVCIGASAFFTTFTGGSGITIVAIGGLLYPALKSEKYPEQFSLGLVTTGGSLGLLFPPSLPLILYGIVGGVVIEKLFLAGLVPGLITLFVLSGYAMWIGVREKMPRIAFDLREALSATREAIWEVLLPVVIVGGLLLDLMRIHEAAAFAAAYTLIIETLVYRDVSFRRDLPRIIRESTVMLGAILIILATAIGFTGYLIQEQVPDRMLDLISGWIQGNPFLFLFLLNVFLLVVGMLMDIFSAIVVVVPLIVPIATHPDIGIDPYHLGIIFLLNLEIGYLTPPVGLNLFISSFRFSKPVTLLYRAVLPFIGLLIVALIATTYIAELSTSLTGLIDVQEMQPMAEPLEDPEDEGDEGDTPTLDDFEDEGGDFTLDDLGDDADLFPGEDPDAADEDDDETAAPTLDDL